MLGKAQGEVSNGTEEANAGTGAQNGGVRADGSHHPGQGQGTGQARPDGHSTMIRVIVGKALEEGINIV